MIATLAMHPMLTESGFEDRQADTRIRVIQAGVATKQDLEVVRAEQRADLETANAELRVQIAHLRKDFEVSTAALHARIDRLVQKVNLSLVGIAAAVVAPLITRLILGSSGEGPAQRRRLSAGSRGRARGSARGRPSSSCVP